MLSDYEKLEERERYYERRAEKARSLRRRELRTQARILRAGIHAENAHRDAMEDIRAEEECAPEELDCLRDYPAAAEFLRKARHARKAEPVVYRFNHRDENGCRWNGVAL